MKIAYCNNIEHLEQLVNDVSLFSGQPTEPHRLPSFAGPNDVLQILGDPNEWLLFTKTIVTLIGAGAISQIGAKLLDWFWDNRDQVLRGLNSNLGLPLARIQRVLDTSRANGFAVSVAIPYSKNPNRNAAMLINELEPIEFLAQVTAFAIAAPRVKALLESLPHTSHQMHIVSLAAAESQPELSTRLEMDRELNVCLPCVMRPSLQGRPDFDPSSAVYFSMRVPWTTE